MNSELNVDPRVIAMLVLTLNALKAASAPNVPERNDMNPVGSSVSM